MIRGLQKQMIQLKTPNSQYFEVVLFVLRPRLARQKESEGEMLREAQKILAESSSIRRPAAAPALTKKQKRSLFFLGALCGGVACAALIALFALLC